MKSIKSDQDSHSPTTERISCLDSLRAIAIIMVVGVHTLGYCVELPQYQGEVISFIVHTISVPVFFLVDGYLFTRSVVYSKSYRYFEYVRKSMFRLLVPWVIFTLTYTLARYAFELTGFLEEKLIVGASWQEVAISAYGSVYAPQMYFLVSLFLIRLCSPVIEQLFIRKNYFITLSLFVCYYAAYKSIIPSISKYLAIAGGQEPALHALWGFQFYLMGIVVFKTSEILDIKRLFIPFLLSFVFALFSKGNLGSYGLNLVQYLYLLTIFIFMTFFRNGFPLLNVIGRNTMGIYLIHAPIVLKGVSLVLNKYALNPMLSYVSVLFATFILSFCIVAAINYVPYSSILFGTPYQQRHL